MAGLQLEWQRAEGGAGGPTPSPSAAVVRPLVVLLPWVWSEPQYVNKYTALCHQVRPAPAAARPRGVGQGQPLRPRQPVPPRASSQPAAAGAAALDGPHASEPLLPASCLAPRLPPAAGRLGRAGGALAHVGALVPAMVLHTRCKPAGCPGGGAGGQGAAPSGVLELLWCSKGGCCGGCVWARGARVGFGWVWLVCRGGLHTQSRGGGRLGVKGDGNAVASG